MSMLLLLKQACGALTPLYPPFVVSMIACLMMLSSNAFGQEEYVKYEEFEFYLGPIKDSLVSEIPCLFTQQITSTQESGVYIVFRRSLEELIPYDYTTPGSEFGVNFITTGDFVAIGLDDDGEISTIPYNFRITEDHCEYGYNSDKKAPPIVLIQL